MNKALAHLVKMASFMVLLNVQLSYAQNLRVLKDFTQGYSLEKSPILYKDKFFFVATDRNANIRAVFYSPDESFSNIQVFIKLPLMRDFYLFDTFFVFKNHLMMIFNDSINKMNLWSSDGTLKNTSIVTNIGAGKNTYLTVVENKILFWMHQLYVSDGTSGGTYAIKDSPYEFQDRGIPYSNTFEIYNNETYFIKFAKDVGYALWKIDSSFQRIKLVSFISDRGYSDQKCILKSFNGKLFFTSFDSAYGSALRVYSGKTDKVEYLTTMGVVSELVSIKIDPLGLLGEKLIFSKYDEKIGTELWLTDGSKQGTSLLINLRKDTIGKSGNNFPDGSSSPRGLIRFEDKIIFSAFSAPRIENRKTIAPLELYITNGTAQGTHLLLDKENKTIRTGLFPRIIYDNQLIFFTSQKTGGGYHIVFTSDGTSAGTNYLCAIGGSYTSRSKFESYKGALYITLDSKLYKLKIE